MKTYDDEHEIIIITGDMMQTTMWLQMLKTDSDRVQMGHMCHLDESGMRCLKCGGLQIVEIIT